MINGVVYRMFCDDSTLVLRQVGHPTIESPGLESGFVVDREERAWKLLAHRAYHVNLFTKKVLYVRNTTSHLFVGRTLTFEI